MKNISDFLINENEDYKFSNPEIQKFCSYLQKIMKPYYNKCIHKDRDGYIEYKNPNENLVKNLRNIWNEIYNYFDGLDVENSKNSEHIPFYANHLDESNKYVFG